MFRDLKTLISSEVLHPSRWGWRFYLVAMIGLLSLNLFGGRGIIHGLIITQESRRLAAEMRETERELEVLNKEINRFERSDVEKFRAVREELGFLRPNEITIEFGSEDGVGSGREVPGAPREAPNAGVESLPATAR